MTANSEDLVPKPPCRMSSEAPKKDKSRLDLLPKLPCRSGSVASEDDEDADRRTRPCRRRSASDLILVGGNRRRRSPLRLRRQNSANSLICLPRSCAINRSEKKQEQQHVNPRKANRRRSTSNIKQLKKNMDKKKLKKEKKKQKKDKKERRRKKKAEKKQDVAPKIPQLKRRRSASDLKTLMQESESHERVSGSMDSFCLYKTKEINKAALAGPGSRPQVPRRRSASDLKTLLKPYAHKDPVLGSLPTLKELLAAAEAGKIAAVQPESEDMPSLCNYQSDYLSDYNSSAPPSPTQDSPKKIASFTFDRLLATPDLEKSTSDLGLARPRAYSFSAFVGRESLSRSSSSNSLSSSCSDSSFSLASEDIQDLMELSTRSGHSIMRLSLNEALLGGCNQRESLFSSKGSYQSRTNLPSCLSNSARQQRASVPWPSYLNSSARPQVETNALKLEMKTPSTVQEQDELDASEYLSCAECDDDMDESGCCVGHERVPVSTKRGMVIATTDFDMSMSMLDHSMLDGGKSVQTSSTATSSSGPVHVMPTTTETVSSNGSSSHSRLVLSLPTETLSQWKCGLCTVENDNVYQFCGMCATPRSWICHVCHFGLNKSQLPHCGGCGARRQQRPLVALASTLPSVSVGE